MADQLVDAAMDAYDNQFAQLALFAFHLANSGSWRNSQWSDGRVAGWANGLIREVAWLKDDWMGGAFSEDALAKFIERRIEGEPVTKRKVLTNYRYMLESAGVLVDGEFQSVDLRQRWFIDAVQLSGIAKFSTLHCQRQQVGAFLRIRLLSMTSTSCFVATKSSVRRLRARLSASIRKAKLWSELLKSVR